MTTYSERTVKCRLCNHSQTVYLLGSCSSFGAPDLDARPAEMARGAIMSILQVCPECGYAAFDISDDVKKPQAVKKLLASFPKSETLSDDYYKAGEIARQISNDHGDAFVYYLRAAWSADDEHNAQKAKEMRSLALKEKMFLLQSTESPAVEDFLQASDIARRAEKFDAAADLIASLDGKEIEPFIRKLVSYEKKLIARKDTACHSVSEIERKKPRNDTLPQSLDEHYCDVIRRRWAEFKYGEGCDWKRLTPAIQSETTEQE